MADRWLPCKRREFIRKLKALGFTGPHRGTRHAYLTCGPHDQTLPSNDPYSVPQLRVLLRQVEAILGRRITRAQWEGL